MAKKIAPESVFVIEAVLGRKLKTVEIESGELERTPRKATLPTRDMSDDEFVAHVMSQPFNKPFEPVAAKPNDSDPYAGIVAEAEAEAERERVHSLSPAQRKLYEVKQAQAKAAKDKADAKALEDHFAKFADTLKALDQLSDSIAADPYWTLEDVQAIENVRLQIAFGPNGDAETTKQLLAGVETIKGRVLGQRKDALATKLREAGLDPADIAAQLEKRFPTEKPADKSAGNKSAKKSALDALRGEDGEPLWMGLTSKATELRTAWETLKADANAKPEDVKAASSAWSKSVSAAMKANSEWEAAVAAEAAGTGEGGAT